LTQKKKTFAMSRHRRTAIFALCLVLAAVLILLERMPFRRRWQPQSNDARKYHAKTYTVVNVVDGDTLDIGVRDGKYDHTRIRLLGIDSPETKGREGAPDYFGGEAARFAAEFALGKQVEIYLDEGSRTRGKYGRLLAYVKLLDDGFLNEVLLTEGFAYADLRFRHSLYNRYKQLEAVARKQQKGLWQDVKWEQLPEWLRRRKPNLLPGK
jgi:micrococcal nuclease